MKKTIFVIGGALLAGLLLGYFIFSGTPEGPVVPGNHEHGEAAGVEMWTCSMHPQIMQPEPGNCPICGMELIPAGSSADGLAPGQLRMSENALALADVQTTRLGTGQAVNRTLRLSGTIEPNEKKIATQSAYFDGRIETLSVNFEGEAVRKGQRLATLYAPELVAAQQELLTASGMKETQPDLYRAVRKKLDLWKLSEAQIREIEASGKVQEYFPVFSDVSGTVSEIKVAAGDYVQKGAPLFRIADLGTVWAEFDAFENQLSILEEGQLVTIRAAAVGGKEYKAPIDFISPVLNATTRTAVVRAVIDNAGGALKPGMFVTAELEVAADAAESGLVVPRSAVLWTGERSVVYVKPDPATPVFELREVQLGAAVPGGYRIQQGLQNGEEVVTNGAFTLDAAAQLQGKKSMMNPTSDGKQAQLHDHGAGGQQVPAANPVKLTDAQQALLREVIGPYLQLKDALVASEAERAGELAASASKLLGSASGGGLEALALDFRALASATGIGEKRDAFIGLSGKMIGLARQVSDLPGTFYIQYCPMANSNQGAYWISSDEAIRNPYYGDAMLTCGEVRETL
ncbi:efflux RND transporter periplasmic adaptor subunit [Robiginitalea sp. SC105]|uniref:efflux RND transporter periplasmic adaptor subunit n=1 Tax=Robiginitalea sp. SC105 TaxID=2762332 RepID=UPI00163980DE|nr:efflux RND transporter periplasmic adaptor subunit [Robiginitalea sp. SC105]MBC2839343.1 efflux RND transporter periplasmic adaptor subunit [Robiginitalea sp. SC105]